MRVVRETNFGGIAPAARGKVRDIYDLGDKLLIVATDRISAFDVVLPDPIPNKGAVLTALSLFWFKRFKDQIENHLIAVDVAKFPAELRKFEKELRSRSMLVKKCTVVPI